jgi:hypothetical protein
MIIFVSVSMFDHKPERCPFGHLLWPGMAQVGWKPLHLHGGFATPRISRVRHAKERRGGDRVLLQLGLVT